MTAKLEDVFTRERVWRFEVNYEDFVEYLLTVNVIKISQENFIRFRVEIDVLKKGTDEAQRIRTGYSYNTYSTTSGWGG